jgi:ABC-2 type transport system ATP-binding protein
MPPILEAHGLTKRFKTTEALAGLALVAERGQVTAILGPNGAGKTTFIRMVATLLLPDAGTLTVAGIDAIREPEKVRRAIGLAGQSAAVESAMTGRENLELIGRLFGHTARQAKASAGVVLDLLGLGDAADRLTRTYSGGMRRKLDLGASLVGAPELLLLDEPTTGLDPRSRNDLWDAIRDLVAAGTDVLLTTQYLDEADHLANRIAIIDQGKVIAEGTPDELKSMAGDDVIQVHVAHLADVDRAIDVLAPMGTGEPRVDRPTRSVAVPVDKGSARLLEAVRAMDGLGLEVSDIGLRRATLDEVFLSLTGRPAESSADDDAGAGAAGAGRPRRGRKAKPVPEESLR